MLFEPDDQFRSGETCPSTGRYRFDGFLDGSAAPLPVLGDMEVFVSAGDVFPPVRLAKHMHESQVSRSAVKACWWVPLEAGASPHGTAVAVAVEARSDAI